MAYLHVYSPCPSGWRFAAEETIEVCRKAVETNFVALWEYDGAAGLRFTHPVDDPLPVEDYLKLVGKYGHLDADQTEHIRTKVGDQITLLSNFSRDSQSPADA
jgi:phenylglyoxylate dehydrogenase beta subunit